MTEGRRIGLPRSLLYHTFHSLWTTFFEELGWRTVTSPPTNRRVLERGVALAVDESCLPMKVFLGHVESLRGHCDAVFVPRIESLNETEHVCAKFMGAYDIVRNTMPDLPLVTYDVDAANGVQERASMLALARELGAGPLVARRAYARAKAAQRAHDLEMVRLQESLLDVGSAERDHTRILVVGHSYNLADELIGKPILEFLRSLDVEVVTSAEVDKPQARALSKRLSPSIKWTYNKELLGAVELYREVVDGIILVVTFPCGPDSLMAELCQRRVEDVPVATLIIDELQAEAGMRTRLESFVDIIEAKRHAAHKAEVEA
ncbi:MAG: acyl-CoA dehydratase activase-related protein [Actinomycetia bacterium]|nr:acyl-CoA dehydratase activase-related protein [Actinomycetes bacterium]